MSTPARESTAALSAAVDRLLARVSHWPPQRWVLPAQQTHDVLATTSQLARYVDLPGSVDPDRPPVTRADLVFALVRALASAAARAEGRPDWPVPRLDHDTSLPDQVRVMVADLIAARPPVEIGTTAVAAIEQVERLL